MPTDDNSFITNPVSDTAPSSPVSTAVSKENVPQSPIPTLSPPVSDAVTTSSVNNNGKRSISKKIVAFFGILLLLGGVAAGVLLVQQQQDFAERASDRISPLTCPLESQPGRTIIMFNEKTLRTDKTEVESFTGPFALNLSEGTYKVTLVSYDNHSDKADQTQDNEVYRLSFWDSNNNEIAASGTISDLPETQDFLTEVVNTSLNITGNISSVMAMHPGYPDTSSPQSVIPVCAAIEPVTVTPTAQCNQVKAFDEAWNPLTLTDLSALEAGDMVRFTVSGTASTGSFDKARFTVNDAVLPEVTEKREGTNEFYIEYTLPSDTDSFTIKGEVYHSTLGWI